ncbi:YheC/YheD family endospore coat-associated protein [Metabacillus arenae]|uniref:YheC/YheD family protein n=1 Tax=Metabacillus arenae TaxID=2771434 RepID=A0A926NSZ3_9BACI|nr:YheC/YheD family protein [Metabacillus arenae]MBD1383361.1 YheC/YheD family protein [Metabacillus arenae]
MSVIYSIELSAKAWNTVILPSRFQHQNLSHLAFGTLNVPCQFTFEPSLKQTIILSEDLIKELKIPYLGKTHLIFSEDTLYLGPLVGIFTAGFTQSLLRPVGERSLLFAKLMAMDSSTGGFVFLFGAHHIDWDLGKISGYIYREGGWKKVVVPFPNVVYDRLPNRKTENHTAIKRVKERLQKDYSIPWFNPGFFNKWDIHQLLSKDESVNRYLPETHLSPTYDQIEQMLATYKSVYLKPANGSLGLGVFKLIYSREEEVYYSRHRDDNHQNRLRKYSSLEHFFKHSFKNRKLEDYLIQQGIRLLRINNNQPVDFRLHANKNQDGQWKIAALAGKVAGKGSVTTHLKSGGTVKTLDEIFEDQRDRLSAMDRLTKAAILLSEAIDSHVDGYIGEIGFDLGIDLNGQVWIFEANSKPGRSIFSHPQLKNEDHLTKKLSLEYALYLTEKTIKSPEEMWQ